MQTVPAQGLNSRLPAPVAPPLIGRDRDLHAVLNLLGAASTRIVTMTGPDGGARLTPYEQFEREPVWYVPAFRSLCVRRRDLCPRDNNAIVLRRHARLQLAVPVTPAKLSGWPARL